MRNPGGYAVITEPDRVTEIDTFSCRHCQHIVHVPPRQDPQKIGGFCYGCGGMVCEQCAGKRTCDPIEAQIERALNSYEARRSYGLI
jgi:hypothetical protein